MQMAAVLKKDHSLKGKNPYRLIKLIRDWDRTDPAVLARIRKDHPLTDYSTADLLGHLEGIVGIPANELFEMASVEGADRPADLPRGYVLFALHCAVLEANARGQPRGTPLQTQAAPAGAQGGTAITTPENQAPNQARGTEQTEEEPGPSRKVSRTA